MTGYEWNFKTILNAAIYAREKLRRQFPVNDSSSGYYRYSGLCDKAIEMLFEKLQEEYTYELLEFKGIHGELAHSLNIPSKFWPRQHTWGCVIITDPTTKEKYKYYVDITGEQFNELLEEVTIPSIYIHHLNQFIFLRMKRILMSNPYTNGMRRLLIVGNIQSKERFMISFVG